MTSVASSSEVEITSIPPNVTTTTPVGATSKAPSATSAPPNTTNTTHSSTSTRLPTSGPNILEIDLHTTVIIPDFHRFYSGNITSFRPSYHALADGSLVASPLISDIRSANIQLASTSAIASFFFLTSWLAALYVRRGKVKRKGLFYALLVSQLLGLGAMVIMLVPYFDQFISCVATGVAVAVLAALSYSLLMTGILGFKAYRVLDSSKLILVVLGAFRVTITIFMLIYLAKSRFTRRLSGGCLPSFRQGLIGVIILLHSAEAAFISICFLIAVWRSSRFSMVRGRLSISVSARDPHDYKGLEEYKAPKEQPDRPPRGWWDYVPPQAPEVHTDTRSLKVATEAHVIARPRKHSVVSAHFAPQSIYPTTMEPRNQSPLPPIPDTMRPDPRAVSPPPASVGSRLSRYMPRMQVFREVVKNELTYCTLVTVILLVVGVLSILGTEHKALKHPVSWVSVAWLSLSLFTMGSFEEVIRRHERDAILQHPAAWDPVYRAELEASRVFASQRNRRPYSPVSVFSRIPPRAPLFTNPFADVYSVADPEHTSRAGSTRSPRALTRMPSASSSSRGLVSPFELSRSSSQVSSASGVSSTSQMSSLGSMLLPPEPFFRHSAPESIHPSPNTANYPALGSFSSVSSDSSDTETRNLVGATALFPNSQSSSSGITNGSMTSLLLRDERKTHDPFNFTKQL